MVCDALCPCASCNCINMPCVHVVVETCSMDMLKNSIKAFVDLGYVSYKRNTYIYVSDQNALTEFVLNKLVL